MSMDRDILFQSLMLIVGMQLVLLRINVMAEYTINQVCMVRDTSKLRERKRVEYIVTT